ncbi:sugar phosphate isomerase/epimerase [Paenibacillus sp.]|uniref:sugar phosphate isomerase/epimerase family protein n=1 Tax=Paenibacillus sp. TaxID=58172 RepID=UPI0028126836|nr:sugar phosphate isomerase/epimerase [Paenibacillus sp.]
MKAKGISSNMYGWVERWKADGKEPTWESLYEACAEAGLDAVETDATPEKLALVRAAGLAVSASYVGVALHGEYDALEAEVLPFAERLAAAGGIDLIVNTDPYGGWKAPLPRSESLLRRQGEHLSRLAERAGALGLRLSLHNHAAERERALADLRTVAEYADAAVGLCVDTGWAHVAGCDPIEWVMQYPERVYAVHLRNQRGRTPTEDLLEGDVDLAAFVEALHAANYGGWLAMELWHPPETRPVRTMTGDVARSVAWLREIAGQ